MIDSTDRAGFTLLEVLVALVIFAVGVLGLTVEAAALTRALARARHAEEVTSAAARRLERLRAGGCLARSDGREIVPQGAASLADLDWSWHDAGDSSYAIRLVVMPAPAPVRSLPPETLTAVIQCR